MPVYAVETLLPKWKKARNIIARPFLQTVTRRRLTPR
jgi:hypothetical protein